MATNYGKQFEQKVRTALAKIPGVSVDRLYDTQNGYKSISQISDCIAYKYPVLVYLELKSIHGNTFPLTNLHQYPKLLTKKNIKGVKAGVLIWYVDCDTEIFVPIKSFERIVKEDFKSINIKTLDLEEYGITKIPGTKKRIFLDCDYSCLFEYNKDANSDE